MLFPLLATGIVSLVSLVGVVVLLINQHRLHQIITWLVSLATGSLVTTAFVHLIPEASHQLPIDQVGLIVVLTILALTVFEQLVHWHHCHDEACQEHATGYTALVSDGLHNFLDGVLIAGAFAVSPSVGALTTLAIVLHEVPQELGDFGVLLHAGFAPKTAALFNLGSALTAVFGAIIGSLALTTVSNLEPVLLAIAAGNFIFLSLTDLLPTLARKDNLAQSLQSLAILTLGVALTLGLQSVLPAHDHEPDHELTEHHELLDSQHPVSQDEHGQRELVDQDHPTEDRDHSQDSH